MIEDCFNFSGNGNPWRGRRVAFFGDSITDPAHIGCSENYWGVLERAIGIVPLVYGVNGHQWCGIPGQIEAFSAENAEGPDAIFVFAGTNDFNSSIPLGEWFSVRDVVVRRSKGDTPVRRRDFIFDDSTLRGRINIAMRMLQDRWPGAPNFLLTPIHRGYAEFSSDNVQPDETHSNELGLFIGDYVDVVKEAGGIWSATVIDLFSESGLFPLLPSHAKFFNQTGTDRLHPSDAGHRRIAAAILRRLGFPTM